MERTQEEINRIAEVTAELAVEAADRLMMVEESLRMIFRQVEEINQKLKDFPVIPVD